MLTKSQARILTREWLDDPDAKRWTDTRIDLAIQLALDDIWTDMLEHQAKLTSQLHSFPDLVSPGYIDLRLTSQGGQLTQRFWRIQHLTRDGREYRPVDDRDVVMQNNARLIGPDFTYYVLGDQLWMFPLDTTTDVELRYSFKPAPFTSMTDGMVVPFPEGSESAYVMLASAMTMAKGGAEDTTQLLAMAETARTRLLSAIARQSVGTLLPYYAGHPSEMGGD